MKYVSAFTGIGGFDLAFNRLGWSCSSMIEVDTFVDPRGKKIITGRYAKKVLAHHWPHVPLLNDIREVHGRDVGQLDLLVGGFPCQDTSIAAPDRQGLNGPRSSMFFEFCRLVDEYARIVDETNPRWVILENPEGLLKSNSGRDMGTVLRTLADLGYMGSWRVVDALGVGLPQRRRRVIVVGHRGEHPCAREVLRDPGAGAVGAPVPHQREGRDPGRPPVGAGAEEHLRRVMFRKSARPRATVEKGGFSTWVPDDYSNTLNGFDGSSSVARTTQLLLDGDRIRSLTLTEWERLQGFPDGWTDVPGMKESYRWTLLGNAMAVPMASWLANRIDSVPNLAAANRRTA